MALTFSQYLQEIRKHSNLTQREMLNHLFSSDPSFSKLDLTTLSRWERGITTPKLSKQLLIARIFGYDIAPLITSKSDVQNKNQHVFDLIARRLLNPYIGGKRNFITRHYDSLDNEPGLCEQLINFHSDYLAMEMKVDAFQKRNLKLHAFLDSSDSFIGHILYAFITTDTPDNMLQPTQLSECPLIEIGELPETPLNLYIVSAYSSLATPRMILILMILDALRQHPEVKYLYVNCHEQEGYTLYTSVDYEIIAKGRELPFGGVKVYGKYYQYIRLKVRADDILSSTIFSNLIPFTKEYIQELQNNE